MSFSATMSVQLQMALMMGVGLLMRKLHLLEKSGMTSLTNILVHILLPCNIIYAALQMDHSALSALLWVFFISIAQQSFTYGISLLLWRRYPREKKAVLRYCLQFSNCGFVGPPVVQSFFGAAALVYSAIYNAPINYFQWTVGCAPFMGGANCSRRELWRCILLHPCVISACIGILFMFIAVPVPAFIENTLASFSNCLAGLSMLLVGGILADANVRGLFQRDVVLVSLFRTLVVPLVIVLCTLPLPVPGFAVRSSAMLAGMPIGSMAAILALNYNCDDVLASSCIVFSTALSLFTIPVVYYGTMFLA